MILVISCPFAAAYAGGSFSRWFARLRSSATSVVTGVQVSIDEIKDEKGASRWLRTVTVKPTDIRHRARDFGVSFAPGLAAFGASSHMKYIFQETFADQATAEITDEAAVWRSRVPQTTQELRAFLENSSASKNRVAKIEISSALMVGFGPATEFAHIRAGSLGVDAKFEGSLALRFENSNSNLLVMSVQIANANEKNIGFNLGGSSGQPDAEIEFSPEGDGTLDIAPRYGGLSTSRGGGRGVAKFISMDLEQRSAVQFLDRLFDRLVSSPSSSLAQVAFSGRALGTAAKLPLLTFDSLFKVDGIAGVTEEGRAESRFAQSAVDGSIGWSMHGEFSQHLKESKFTLTSEDGRSLSFLQNSFSLDSKLNLLRNWFYRSRERTVQMTNRVTPGGEIADIIELSFTSRYEGRRLSSSNQNKIIDHFTKVLPDASVEEIFGHDGSNLRAAEKFSLATAITVHGNAIEALRSTVSPNLSRLNEGQIESLLLKYLNDPTNGSQVRWSASTLRDCVKSLTLMVDKTVDPARRIGAFKHLRFNGLFKEIGVGFFLNAIPRAQWPTLFSITLFANYTDAKGHVTSKETQLGSPKNIESTMNLIEARESAMGESHVTPNEIVNQRGASGHRCEDLFLLRAGA